MSSNTNQNRSSNGGSHKKESRQRGPSSYKASSTPDYYYTEEPQTYVYQQPAANDEYSTYSSSGYYERPSWKWTCCVCGTGGMSINTAGCMNIPHCYHNRCGQCSVWQH